MKKIVALLLTMVLTLSLCGMLMGCGGDTPPATDTPTGENPPAEPTELELFAEKIARSDVLDIRTEITIVTDGATLKASTVLNEDENTVTYQTLNKIDPDNLDAPFMSEETLTAKAGENTVIIGDLQITAANLADVKIENGVLTATITNPSGFFGTTLTSYTTAQVTIYAEEGYLTDMTVTYTAVNGAAVTLTVEVE